MFLFANIRILLREVGKFCVKVNTFYWCTKLPYYRKSSPPIPNEIQTLSERGPKGEREKSISPPLERNLLFPVKKVPRRGRKLQKPEPEPVV